jgi:hypothetical protein
MATLCGSNHRRCDLKTIPSLFSTVVGLNPTFHDRGIVGLLDPARSQPEWNCTLSGESASPFRWPHDQTAFHQGLVKLSILASARLIRYPLIMRKFLRLEWISVLYLALFVLAVLTPRLVTRGVIGLDEVQVEEGMIFFFGITGLVTFSLYERLMEHREQEKNDAVRERDTARQELVSSYEYIGAVNRQIESLKRLANQTATSVVGEEDAGRKELFQTLAASAAALARSPHATIRVVALDRLRTIREYHADPQTPLRVANKELLRVHEEGKASVLVRGEDGRDIIVVPSDHQPSPSKTFILVRADTELPRSDADLLKVYANQAELLHHALGRKDRPAIDSLSLVREAERRAVGQVS